MKKLNVFVLLLSLFGLLQADYDSNLSFHEDCTCLSSPEGSAAYNRDADWEAVLNGASPAGKDLSNRDLRSFLSSQVKRDDYSLDFSNSNLEGSNLDGISCQNPVFAGANLKNASMKNPRFKHTYRMFTRGTNIEGTNFEGYVSDDGDTQGLMRDACLAQGFDSAVFVKNETEINNEKVEVALSSASENSIIADKEIACDYNGKAFMDAITNNPWTSLGASTVTVGLVVVAVYAYNLPSKEDKK